MPPVALDAASRLGSTRTGQICAVIWLNTGVYVMRGIHTEQLEDLESSPKVPHSNSQMSSPTFPGPIRIVSALHSGQISVEHAASPTVVWCLDEEEQRPDESWTDKLDS